MFNNFVFYNSIRTIITSITTHWGSKTMLLIFDEFNDVSHYCIKQRPLYGFSGGVLPITISSTIDRITLAGEPVLHGDYSVYRNLVL